MLETTQRSIDAGLQAAMDGAGLIGPKFREGLLHELKSKVILRSAKDPIEIVGATGSGKHAVALAAHLAGKNLLDKDGAMVTYHCDTASTDRSTALDDMIEDARHGTLVLERFGALNELGQRALLRRIENSQTGALVVSLKDAAAPVAHSRSTELPAPIRIKPLHEREDDIWALVDHFFAACVRDAADAAFEARCRGFSRQAKGDIAQVVENTELASVRQLRIVVRDIVFEALSLPEVPIKIKSDNVRPYLEARFGQTSMSREQRDAELVRSRFDALVDRSLLEQLAELHNVPAGLLERQAELVAEITGYIDDMPRSYRNILDRAEDLQRAGVWLMTGARTQAEFRRFFGEERYMRPTKSVAWAFYNRVFKRDM